MKLAGNNEGCFCLLGFRRVLKHAQCSIRMILGKHQKKTTNVCKSLYKLPAPFFVLDFHFILFVYTLSSWLQILRELGLTERFELLKFSILKH